MNRLLILADISDKCATMENNNATNGQLGSDGKDVLARELKEGSLGGLNTACGVRDNHGCRS